MFRKFAHRTAPPLLVIVFLQVYELTWFSRFEFGTANAILIAGTEE